CCCHLRHDRLNRLPPCLHRQRHHPAVHGPNRPHRGITPDLQVIYSSANPITAKKYQGWSASGLVNRVLGSHLVCSDRIQPAGTDKRPCYRPPQASAMAILSHCTVTI